MSLPGVESPRVAPLQVFHVDHTQFHHHCPPDRRSADRVADDRRPLRRGDRALRAGRHFRCRRRLHRQALRHDLRARRAISTRSPTRRCSSPSSSRSGFKGLLPPWLIVLVVSRDLFIIGGMLLAYVLTNPMPVRPLLGVQGEHGGADPADRLRSWRSLRGLARPFALLIWLWRIDRRRRRLTVAFRRLAVSRSSGSRHMAGRALGRRPGAEEGTCEPPDSGAVLARRACCSCSSSCGCSAASCCRSSWAWRSPICSIRSPTGWSGVGMNRFWATITIVILSVLVFSLVGADRHPAAGRRSSRDFLARPAELCGASCRRSATASSTREIGQYFGSRKEGGSSIDQWVSQGAAWVGSFFGSLLGRRPGADERHQPGRRDAGRRLLPALRLGPDAGSASTRCCRASTPRRSARSASDINGAIAGFIRGQGAVCLILGLFYAISLSVVGLNFGFLIGSAAGVISFIPYVGSIVGFVLSVGVALVQFWPDWLWVVGRRRHLRRRPVPRRQHPAAAAGRVEHRRASGVADVRALRLRLALRLRRRAARRAGDGGDRRAGPLRRRALPA